MARKDITGHHFGRLTVLYRNTAIVDNRNSSWVCRCDCGTVKSISRTCLVSGDTQSCGCYRNDRIHETLFKYGSKTLPEYRLWSSAKRRCTKINDPRWAYYGGRGIRMCDEWMQSFAAFYTHMGPRPAGLTLDRIDNNKGYEPGNCRWATRSQQNKNRRPFKT